MGHNVAELGGVQFFFPAADDDGGNTIADYVGEGAAFAHEFVDADEKSERLNRDGRDGGEDGGEGDEASASDAGGAFGGDHGEEKDADHLPELEMGVRRLRKENRGESEIDVGAVGVEAVAGGKDEADDGARSAEALELLHHVREDRFGGAGAEDDEEFVLDIGDETEDGKAGGMRDDSENEDDEDQAGGVERADQLEEIGKGGDAVAGHGEGHAAESAERGGADNDTDDGENDFGEDGEAAGERFATSAKQRDGEAGKNGNEQDLENIAGGEGVNEGARGDGEQEGDDAGFFGAAGVNGSGFGIERGGIDVEAGAGMKKNGDENADDEGDCGDDFKIKQSFDADAADFFEIGHGSNALNDDAENHGGDHHSNQGDEGVAERLEDQAGLWREMADQNADRDGDEQLEVENRVPRFARRGGWVRGDA